MMKTCDSARIVLLSSLNKALPFKKSPNNNVIFIYFNHNKQPISCLQNIPEKEMEEFLSELESVKSENASLLSDLDSTIAMVKSHCFVQTSAIQDVFLRVERLLFDSKSAAVSAINERLWACVNELEQRKYDARLEDKRLLRNESDIARNADKIVAEMEVAEIQEILASYRNELQATRTKIQTIFAETHLELLVYDGQSLQRDLDVIHKLIQTELFQPKKQFAEILATTTTTSQLQNSALIAVEDKRTNSSSKQKQQQPRKDNFSNDIANNFNVAAYVHSQQQQPQSLSSLVNKNQNIQQTPSLSFESPQLSRLMTNQEKKSTSKKHSNQHYTQQEAQSIPDLVQSAIISLQQLQSEQQQQQSQYSSSTSSLLNQRSQQSQQQHSQQSGLEQLVPSKSQSTLSQISKQSQQNYSVQNILESNTKSSQKISSSLSQQQQQQQSKLNITNEREFSSRINSSHPISSSQQTRTTAISLTTPVSQSNQVVAPSQSLGIVEMSISEKQQTQESDDQSSVQGGVGGSGIVLQVSGVESSSKIMNKSTISSHKIISYSDIHEDTSNNGCSTSLLSASKKRISSTKPTTPQEKHHDLAAVTTTPVSSVNHTKSQTVTATAAASSNNHIVLSEKKHMQQCLSPQLVNNNNGMKNQQYYHVSQTPQQNQMKENAYSIGSCGQQKSTTKLYSTQTEPTHLQANKFKVGVAAAAAASQANGGSSTAGGNSAGITAGFTSNATPSSQKTGNFQRNLMMHDEQLPQNKFKLNSLGNTQAHANYSSNQTSQTGLKLQQQQHQQQNLSSNQLSHQKSLVAIQQQKQNVDGDRSSNNNNTNNQARGNVGGALSHLGKQLLNSTNLGINRTSR